MRVLIVGGGIAGLTCAIALRQRGIEARVFESSEQRGEPGAGLMLAANALSVLERLGLLHAVRERGVAASGLGVHRIDGTPLQLTSAEEWESRYGHRTLVMLRSALHATLREALDPDCVLYGRRVVDVAQGEASASLGFEDGTREDGDLVVGADGLRSRVRETQLGPAEYRYAGETSWRGVSDTVIQTGPLAHSMVEIWGTRRGHRFGFGPVSTQQTYFFATQFSPAGGRDESPGAALAGLRDSFAEFVPEVQQLLAHTPPERLLRTDIFDFKPLSRWYSGRVVLIGDAAHATTPNLGQGGCQAIESAYVLAEQLSRAELSSALRSYQAIRMAKAHFVTRTSYQIGKVADMPGPFGRWLRYRLIPRTPKSVTFKQMDRIYRLNY